MRILTFTLLILLASGCCKNDDKPEVKIVETDNNGNVTNRNGSNDWLPMDRNDDGNFGQLLFQIQYFMQIRGITRTLRFDCPSDSIRFKLYANPVAAGQNPIIEVKADRRIIDIAIGFRSFSQAGVSYLEGGLFDSDPSLFDNDKTYRRPIELQSFLDRSDNLELYVAVVTEDNCTYFTKGKILYH